MLHVAVRLNRPRCATRTSQRSNRGDASYRFAARSYRNWVRRCRCTSPTLFGGTQQLVRGLLFHRLERSFDLRAAHRAADRKPEPGARAGAREISARRAVAGVRCESGLEWRGMRCDDNMAIVEARSMIARMRFMSTVALRRRCACWSLLRGAARTASGRQEDSRVGGAQIATLDPSRLRAQGRPCQRR